MPPVLAQWFDFVILGTNFDALNSFLASFVEILPFELSSIMVSHLTFVVDEDPTVGSP